MSDRITSEKWCPLPGYGDVYEVSDCGRVRSKDRLARHQKGGMQRIYGRAMSTYKSDDASGGHWKVALTENRRQKIRSVHVLVLEAHVCPRPEALAGCHNDGNPDNNHVSNLRWDTLTENQIDKVWHATHPGTVRPEVAARIAKEAVLDVA